MYAFSPFKELPDNTGTNELLRMNMSGFIIRIGQRTGDPAVN